LGCNTRSVSVVLDNAVLPIRTPATGPKQVSDKPAAVSIVLDSKCSDGYPALDAIALDKAAKPNGPAAVALNHAAAELPANVKSS
jgi:hypothetical protein